MVRAGLSAACSAQRCRRSGTGTRRRVWAERGEHRQEGKSRKESTLVSPNPILTTHPSPGPRIPLHLLRHIHPSLPRLNIPPQLFKLSVQHVDYRVSSCSSCSRTSVRVSVCAGWSVPRCHLIRKRCFRGPCACCHSRLCLPFSSSNRRKALRLSQPGSQLSPQPAPPSQLSTPSAHRSSPSPCAPLKSVCSSLCAW